MNESFLAKVQEVCDDVSRTTSPERLYENLIPFIAKVCDTPASALITAATKGAAGNSFWVVQGTGRFSGSAGGYLRHAEVQQLMEEAVARGSNVYAEGRVVFHFSHPECLGVLAYFDVRCGMEPEQQALLAFVNDKVASAIQAHTLAKRADRTRRAMVISLADLAEHRDHDTGAHIMRLAIMTDEIVHKLAELGHYRNEITREFKRFIGTASVLHDIGKVAIPEEVLKKPGKLDAEERRIIEEHTRKGQQALKKASRILDESDYLLQLSSEIALHHHEHYDGSGYPTRAAGQQIPLSARIVGLADVFDALVSERRYKQAWTEQEAVAFISARSGKQFDPLVVEAFLRVMDCRREASLIRWTPVMSVKEQHLDGDHRVLIALINQLSSAEKIGNRRNIEFVLDELVDYTIDHFNREESYLCDRNYPPSELARHKLLHAEFTRVIQEIRWQYQNGFRSGLNQELLRFLREWLSKHILVEDMKYAAARSSGQAVPV